MDTQHLDVKDECLKSAEAQRSGLSSHSVPPKQNDSWKSWIYGTRTKTQKKNVNTQPVGYNTLYTTKMTQKHPLHFKYKNESYS